MRSILAISTILAVLFINETSAQQVDNSNEYMITSGNQQSASYFDYGKHSYVEYFQNNKKEIKGHEYSVLIRRYSWGKNDTTYYRVDEHNYLHFNQKTQSESIVLPRVPKKNYTWYENDSSWVYKILETDQKFKTPAKKYRNCVLVKANQLTNRDPEKFSEYYLYYSKGIGYVGNSDNKGNILSYLKEIVVDAKEGTKIGGN